MSFPKFSGGDTPGPSQRGGAPPSAPNTQPSFWPGAGRKRPVLGPKPWSPSTFQLWLRPCVCVVEIQTWPTQDNSE